MPTYKYTAIDAAGKSAKGKLTAANELDLEERIQAIGLTLMSHKAVKAKKGRFFSKVSTKELIMFCVHLEQLDRAGVPLLDALADMRDSADSPKFRDIMADIYESVKGGEILSTALSKRKEVFNDVFIGLVKAGEKTGNMSGAFAHLAHHLKWNQDIKRSVRKALTYPITLVVVMTGVVTMMMLYVVPQLVSFLKSQGFDLPWYTLWLIAFSGFMANYWWAVLSIPPISVMIFFMFYRASSKVHYVADKIFLKTPFLGPVILKINLARFSHFFSITFSSGIGVLECLSTARNVVGSHVMKEAIQFIIQNVSDGSSLTRSISATQRFPSLVIRMFKVGEDSGNMEEALNNINFFYDREVQDSINRMIAVLQPMLTIVMGVVMFWVIAAVFGPLYQSFKHIAA